MNKKLLSIIASTTLFSNLALADENSGFFIGALMQLGCMLK